MEIFAKYDGLVKKKTYICSTIINYTTNMKIKNLLLLSVLMLSGSSVQAQTTAVDPDATGMEMTAQEWTKGVVMGWNLGNSLECPTSETSWGNPKTTKEMIHVVREAGFNGIRIPIRWADHLADAATMTIDEAWLKRVQEIVDWCLEEDMFVVINDHHEEWYDRHPTYDKQEENNQKLAALWTNVATYFRDYGCKLAFAGTNETTINWANPTKENQEVQNSYNQTFVDAVRATGGKNYYRVLVVQTYACSPYHGLSGFVIPEDPAEKRLCVEYHYYDPYGYGLLSDNASQNYYYWGEAYKAKAEAQGMKVPSDNEKTQENLFERIRKKWWDEGLGVVMGEFGVTNHFKAEDKETQQENMSYYLKTTLGHARERGFAAFLWDNNGFGNGNEKFGLFRRSGTTATVGNEYFLKGLCEGAGIEYHESEGGGEDGGETVEGGDVIWEGDEMMDWGNGLQLPIANTEFSGYSKDVRLILDYTLDFSDYNMIQFFYGDWKENPSFIIDGITYEKEYTPSNVHPIGNGEDGESIISFSEDVYNTLKEKGMNIQGHGVRLKKVVLADPTGIRSVFTNTDDNSPVYNLAGQQVKSTKKGVYIKNGKKYIVK